MSDRPAFIPLSIPNLDGRELEYVSECITTGWISSVGAYVDKFERAVEQTTGAKHAVACVNGTAALHIGLVLKGVGPGDYVLMPNLTFVATANAIRYTGAEPILVDVDAETWQMDLDLLEGFLAERCERDGEGVLRFGEERRPVRAIMPVHVQGNIGDVGRLLSLAREYGLAVVEDAAEALGSTYEGRSAGTLAELGALSFNGNKIISTGGGGVILTDDPELAARAKHLTTTAKTDPLEYFHDEIGYNYRMVNVLAAIGVAQLERFPHYLQRKNEIGDRYREGLAGVGDIGFQKVLPGVRHNDWLFTITTEHQRALLAHLNEARIQSRPFWMPMSRLPMYAGAPYVTHGDVSRDVHARALSIPCSTNLKPEDQDRVIEEIRRFFAR